MQVLSLLLAALSLVQTQTPPPVAPPTVPPPPPPKVIQTDFVIGTGEEVKIGDQVTVDYVGSLTNGKEFDSSKKPGRTPFVFIVGFGQVIRGWDQGLLGMKVGGKRKLKIPPELGYGDRSIAEIPANSTLLFNVELRKIEHPGQLVKIETTKSGTGPAAKFGDMVTVNYRGTLTDGTEFDNSYKTKQPFDLTLGGTRVIPGFIYGILGMQVNEKRKVTIPAVLAYGSRAQGPIPANSDLVFELEMIRIVPPAPPVTVPPTPTAPADSSTTKPPTGGTSK